MNLEKTQFGYVDPIYGTTASSDASDALVHSGDLFSLTGILTIADGDVGGFFVVPTQLVAASVTVDMANVDADLTYTAVTAGSTGNAITVTHTDPSDVDQPLTIVVSGTDINILLATGADGTITSTASEVKTAINSDPDASALVACEDESAGAGVVEAKASASLSGGTDPLGISICLRPAGFSSNSAVSVSLLENYVMDPGDTVTALTGLNHLRSAADATAVITGGTDITPTAETGHATLGTISIEANAPMKTLGQYEWVLSAGVNYCIAISNSSGSPAVVSYDLSWSEVTL